MSHLPLKDIIIFHYILSSFEQKKRIFHMNISRKKRKKKKITIRFIDFPFKSGAPLTSSKRDRFGDFDARTRHEAK